MARRLHRSSAAVPPPKIDRDRYTYKRACFPRSRLRAPHTRGGGGFEGNKRVFLGEQECQERPKPCSTHTASRLGTPPEPGPDGIWMLVIAPSCMTSHTENDT